MSKHEFIKNEAQTLLKLNAGQLKTKKPPTLSIPLMQARTHGINNY